MPILKQEDDLFPPDLLQLVEESPDESRHWFCLYTLSRREKELMRKLRSMGIGFYSPIIAKRFRSPNGRLRTSYVPLFPNYVFLYASEVERHQAMTTNCISRCNEITNPEELVVDLRQIREAIGSGTPLTPEARLVAGQRVRVRSGLFRGYEGVVIRREGKTRLLLSIRYLEKGVSMEIDEGLLEPL
jgi:transcription antitermination factor NusG